MIRSIVKAVTSVKTIDEKFKKLSQTENQVKITKLIESTSQVPEINDLLVKFLKGLNHIGINQVKPRVGLPLKLNYWIRLPKFIQLHSIIWETCRLHDISQRHYRLKFNIQNIGILDPKNFPLNYYKKYIDKK